MDPEGSSNVFSETLPENKLGTCRADRQKYTAFCREAREKLEKVIVPVEQFDEIKLDYFQDKTIIKDDAGAYPFLAKI